MEKLRINRNLVLLGVLLVVFVLFSGLVNAACYNYENNCKITGGSGDIYTQPRCSDTVPGVKEVPQCGTSDTTNQYGCGFDNSHKKEVMVDYSYCQLKSNPGAGDPTEWVLLEDVMIEEGGTKVFYPRENKYGEYSPKCLANGKTIQYSKKHISGYYGNLANSVNDYNAQETCLDNSFCYYKSGFGTEVRCGECELDNNFVCTDYSTVDRGGNPTHKVYPKRVVGESISHNQIKHSKCVQGKCSDTLTEVNTCDYAFVKVNLGQGNNGYVCGTAECKPGYIDRDCEEPYIDGEEIKFRIKKNEKILDSELKYYICDSNQECVVENVYDCGENKKSSDGGTDENDPGSRCEEPSCRKIGFLEKFCETKVGNDWKKVYDGTESRESFWGIDRVPTAKCVDGVCVKDENNMIVKENKVVWLDETLDLRFLDKCVKVGDTVKLFPIHDFGDFFINYFVSNEHISPSMYALDELNPSNDIDNNVKKVKVYSCKESTGLDLNVDYEWVSFRDHSEELKNCDGNDERVWVSADKTKFICQPNINTNGGDSSTTDGTWDSCGVITSGNDVGYARTCESGKYCEIGEYGCKPFSVILSFEGGFKQNNHNNPIEISIKRSDGGYGQTYTKDGKDLHEADLTQFTGLGFTHPGDYTLKVSAQGYQDKEFSFTILDGQDAITAGSYGANYINNVRLDFLDVMRGTEVVSCKSNEKIFYDPEHVLEEAGWLSKFGSVITFGWISADDTTGEVFACVPKCIKVEGEHSVQILDQQATTKYSPIPSIFTTPPVYDKQEIVIPAPILAGWKTKELECDSNGMAVRGVIEIICPDTAKPVYNSDTNKVDCVETCEDVAYEGSSSLGTHTCRDLTESVAIKKELDNLNYNMYKCKEGNCELDDSFKFQCTGVTTGTATIEVEEDHYVCVEKQSCDPLGGSNVNKCDGTQQSCGCSLSNICIPCDAHEVCVQDSTNLYECKGTKLTILLPAGITCKNVVSHEGIGLSLVMFPSNLEEDRYEINKIPDKTSFSINFAKGDRSSQVQGITNFDENGEQVFTVTGLENLAGFVGTQIEGMRVLSNRILFGGKPTVGKTRTELCEIAKTEFKEEVSAKVKEIESEGVTFPYQDYDVESLKPSIWGDICRLYEITSAQKQVALDIPKLTRIKVKNNAGSINTFTGWSNIKPILQSSYGETILLDSSSANNALQWFRGCMKIDETVDDIRQQLCVYDGDKTIPGCIVVMEMRWAGDTTVAGGLSDTNYNELVFELKHNGNRIWGPHSIKDLEITEDITQDSTLACSS